MRSAHRSRPERGRCTVTVVPWPGDERIALRPPRILARSAIPLKPIPAAAAEGGGVEPGAVVLDRDARSLRRSTATATRPRLRLGVAGQVAEPLLHDPVDVDLVVLGEGAVDVPDLGGDRESRGRRRLLHERHAARGAAPAGRAGTGAGRRRSCAPPRSPRPPPSEISADLRRGVVAVPQAEQRAVADDDQRLADAVVQLARDALALGLLRLEQAPREGVLLGPPALQARDAPPVGAREQAGQKHHGPGPEPERLPPEGPHADGEGRRRPALQTPSLLAAVTCSV